eukprot:GDKH01010825.1.p1 GENE.GDKH01010825.1~~GDKH01010825.1.p1  ORF type:complete len:190 (+),score=73.56 GDKH01010825.1:69-638(+)
MAAVDEKKIHEVESDSDSDSSEDMPDLENQENGGEESQRAKQNRAEKKSRKAVLKLGMKQVPGIVRVTIKKSKNILFVLGKPDVYKNAASDTYVVFGDAKIDDMTAVQANQAAQNFTQIPEGPAEASGPAVSKKVVEEVDEGDVDETGVEAKDIDLVMAQVKDCSRGKAVAALRHCKNDVVDAIVHLQD